LVASKAEGQKGELAFDGLAVAVSVQVAQAAGYPRGAWLYLAIPGYGLYTCVPTFAGYLGFGKGKKPAEPVADPNDPMTKKRERRDAKKAQGKRRYN